MFSSTKTGHMAHIIATALIGQMAGNELAPPDPSTVEQHGHLIVQVLVAIVTIWATVRKALQKPESMVKSPAVLPAEAAPVVPAGTDGKAE